MDGWDLSKANNWTLSYIIFIKGQRKESLYEVVYEFSDSTYVPSFHDILNLHWSHCATVEKEFTLGRILYKENEEIDNQFSKHLERL